MSIINLRIIFAHPVLYLTLKKNNVIKVMGDALVRSTSSA